MIISLEQSSCELIIACCHKSVPLVPLPSVRILTIHVTVGKCLHISRECTCFDDDEPYISVLERSQNCFLTWHTEVVSLFHLLAILSGAIGLVFSFQAVVVFAAGSIRYSIDSTVPGLAVSELHPPWHPLEDS